MALKAVTWIDTETGARIDETSPPGDPSTFAVRFTNNYCLNKSGDWVHEPLPSERDDAFLKNCRWSTLEEAEKALRKADFSIFPQYAKQLGR